MSLVKSHRGFTLLEMLVALSLLGLLSAGIFEVYRFAQRTYTQVLRVGAAQDEVRVAQQFLRRLLEQLPPPSPAESEPSGLQATATELRVLGGQSLAGADSPTWRYRLRLRDRAEGLQDLWVSRSEVLPAASDSASGSTTEEVLLAGISAVRWDFLPQEHRLQAPGLDRWASQWSEKAALPALVRISVQFPTGDRRRWPELMAIPRLSAGSHCEFDAVSQGCRL